MAEVTYTAEELNNYTKKQLIDMFLEKESTAKSLSDLTCEIQKLTGVVTRLESEISVVRRVNDELQRQLVSTERQCWANAQYSRRECLEVSGIPISISDDNLEKKVLKVFEKMGVTIHADNIEACHRLKSGSDRTIVKFSKRKDCQQVMKVKKDLKNMDFSDIDLPVGTNVYVNESLCSYYRWLWSLSKQLKNRKKIHSFYTINGTLKVKISEGDKPRIITHVEDLKEIAPGFDFEKK